MATPVLGYWDIRGFAEPIRYMLAYVGEDYEDKRYPFLSDGDPRGAWLKEKYTLGLEFPNLPYYIDDKVKLTQSLAILRYIARKYGLVDESSVEGRARMEMVEQQIQDIRQALFFFIFSKPDYKDYKDQLIQRVDPSLKLLSNLLVDKDWLLGDKITYVDFLAYESLTYYQFLLPKYFENFPKLKEFMTRFEKLPAIEKHQSSPVYKESPFFGPVAYWGYKDRSPIE